MTIRPDDKRWPTELHYWAGALLALAVIPFLKRLDLPVKVDWANLASAYWLVLAAQSIFVAALLCVIGFGPATTLGPLLERMRRNQLRLALWLTFFLILYWAFSGYKAIRLTADVDPVRDGRH